MSTDPNEKTITPVATLSALPLKSFSRGESYASADNRVADAIGLTQIGATYSEVPPGKSGCPYHVHHGVDEMFVILEGQGRYRFGDATYEVRAGDVLGAPRGRAEFAHKLTNTGATPLKYLAISSVATNDVLEYPDSGKLMAVSDFGTDAEGFHFIGRANSACGYWDDEPDSAD
ncbi:MAG: cupin domain-containing protein [Gammaproteobacteria bacterium]|nr:cupin domain-containing protein [Gammaproteobacteria bacterium]MYF50974.1 cupin domain-containing protein [Gammaproteobacteria bacterium]